MPTDACLWFYECESCKTVLRPRAGDCCVFCSYGTHRCPPIQAASSCCQHGAKGEDPIKAAKACSAALDKPNK